MNHYYLYLVQEEQPDTPVANHFLPGDDPERSSRPPASACSTSADNHEDAESFVEFLLSDEGQRFYTERAEEAEYPLVAGIPVKEGLPPIESLGGPDIDFTTLGEELERTSSC